MTAIAAAVKMTKGLPLSWTSSHRALSGSLAGAAPFLESRFVEVPPWISTHPARARRAGVREVPDGARITEGVAAVVLGDAALDPLFLLPSEGS